MNVFFSLLCVFVLCVFSQSSCNKIPNKLSGQDTLHREREITLVVSDVAVKRYQECSFSAEVEEKFSTRKKRGDYGNAFKVTEDRRQLGHLKGDLVTPLWRKQI